jgi:hypothetical protein
LAEGAKKPTGLERSIPDANTLVEGAGELYTEERLAEEVTATLDGVNDVLAESLLLVPLSATPAFMLLVPAIVSCNGCVDQVELEVLLSATVSNVVAVGDAICPIPGRLNGKSYELLGELAT